MKCVCVDLPVCMYLPVCAHLHVCVPINLSQQSDLQRWLELFQEYLAGLLSDGNTESQSRSGIPRGGGDEPTPLLSPVGALGAVRGISRASLPQLRVRCLRG